MLEIDDLTLVRGDEALVESLCLRVDAGDILHVQGPNGVGKTTLLRAIAGLVLPETGSVSWCGTDVRGRDNAAFNDTMLFLGHQPGLKASLSPAENLVYYRALRTAGGCDVRRALSHFGLTDVADRPSGFLSAGQQRRAGLARLLSERARLWILDEPFATLDDAGTEKLASLIRTHAARDGLVVITSHQALAMATRVARIADWAGVA